METLSLGCRGQSLKKYSFSKPISQYVNASIIKSEREIRRVGTLNLHNLSSKNYGMLGFI